MVCVGNDLATDDMTGRLDARDKLEHDSGVRLALMSEPANYLLYDGECPACRSYVAFSRLRQLYPDIVLLDAREESDLVADLRRHGYEINEGMVLKLREAIHFGPAATRMIAELGQSAPSPATRWGLHVIGGAVWSEALYPWLNRCRQLLLRALGRTLIR